MRIVSLLNVTEQDLVAKKFNIFIGISLGKKYFSKENTQAYIEWALQHTKEKVAVLIPDKIHAVNYEVKNNYSPERAAAHARRKGDEVEMNVAAIINKLNIPSSKLEIVHWNEIENGSYLQMLDVLRVAFHENPVFHKTVIEITKNAPRMGTEELSDAQYEKLSEYVINELPMLISGFEKDSVDYNLLPYPGFVDIDYLAIDLQEGKTFPDITKKLNIKNKCRLIEAYTD